MKPSQLVFAGGIVGALGVTLGAFGAHWLEGAVQQWSLSADEQARAVEVWQVAVRYQLIHALALTVTGLLALKSPSRWLSAAGWLFLVGVLVFSGLLYVLVLSGVKVLGAIVPIGGLAMILGWLALAVGGLRGEA